MKSNVTVHMMIKNEEFFIKKAIESVLVFADEIIVFDTGSTDNTREIVNSIDSKKIRLFEKGTKTPKELIGMRNEMIKLTKTKWFMVVDGDEIIYFKHQNKLAEALENIPGHISRVELTMRDFVKDKFLVARDRRMGKIWRTNTINFRGEYPFEWGSPEGKTKSEIESFSTRELENSAISYHMCFFARSQKDLEVKVGRHWRQIPFPVLPFFGPWPKQMDVKSSLIFSIIKLPIYNLTGLVQKIFRN